jgi:hypothetical protein
MVKLRDLKGAFQAASTSPDYIARMREIQNRIDEVTKPTLAMQNLIASVKTEAIGYSLIPPPGTDFNALNSITDGLAKASQAKNQREKETHDHTLKQTALLEQLQDIQLQLIGILNDQTQIASGMLSESRNNTGLTRLAVYFAALSAAVGLIALLLK